MRSDVTWRRCGLASALISALWMTGCATLAGSETNRATCQELRAVLPTYSRQDTEESKRQGVEFLSVFGAVCPE